MSSDLRSRMLTAVISLVIAGAAVATGMPADGSAALQPTHDHGRLAEFVAQRFDVQHYRRRVLDAGYSGQVLDRYLESLDPNRSYLLASDLAEFDRYRDELANRLRAQNVDPGFVIFARYVERIRERIAFARSFLEQEPDLTVPESYRFDRREAPWATSVSELDELWRLRLKNDAINLMLADQTWEEAAEIMSGRLDRQERRVSEIDADEVFETYINAFAWVMDPHSQYMSPISSEEYQIDMSASVEGVGATLNIQDEYVTVVEVIPGGPAHTTDALHPEDRIIGVGQGDEGEMVDVVGWRLIDVVRLIRGPKGSVVRLRIAPAIDGPDAQPVTRSVVRDRVKIEAAAAHSEILEVEGEHGLVRVGVIEVPTFYQDGLARRAGETDYSSVTRDVARLTQELMDQGIDALLLDMRNNGGGYLNEVVDMVGLYIDEGPVVQTAYTGGALEVERDDDGGRTIYDGPLAVLVNRFSASATEIFAAAVQDYQRGVVIGQRTYGKGTVQGFVNLNQQYGALKLTMGKYYRVTGESTQHRGVIPDIELPSMIDEGQVGESIWATALPWDTIESVDFDPGGYAVSNTLPDLRYSFDRWSADDANLDVLQADVARVRENNDISEISLVLAERQADRDRRRDERLALENQRRIRLGMDPLEDLEALGDEELPDLTLQTAAEIAGDLWRLQVPETAELRRAGASPTS